MRIYQTIRVVNIRQPQEFVSGLLNRAQVRHWTPRPDYSISAKKSMPDFEGEYVCLESPIIVFNKKKIAGIVWIRVKEQTAESFNVVPTIGYYLSVEEYNCIIASLYSTVVAPLSENMGLEASLSNDILDLNDILGQECFKALTEFSESANKSTGSSYPSDFNRWCHFIILMHKHEIDLDLDLLSGWLADNGWSENVVNDLLDQYEFSQGLLKYYDESVKK